MGKLTDEQLRVLVTVHTRLKNNAKKRQFRASVKSTRLGRARRKEWIDKNLSKLFDKAGEEVPYIYIDRLADKATVASEEEIKAIEKREREHEIMWKHYSVANLAQEVLFHRSKEQEEYDALMEKLKEVSD